MDMRDGGVAAWKRNANRTYNKKNTIDAPDFPGLRDTRRGFSDQGDAGQRFE